MYENDDDDTKIVKLKIIKKIYFKMVYNSNWNHIK